MLNLVNHLSHFTRSYNALESIVKEGFMPSYAKEKLAKREVMVSMISFSNVLLRDVGDEEVLSYGQYALIFDRDWGIANILNPVSYTYEDGLLDEALTNILKSTIFLH